MSVSWTKPQQDAIDARDRSIIVSAAAGSGKTAVLVERVFKLITDKENPVDIDKLIIVTFTNKAAAEMRARISKRLNEELAKNVNDTNIVRQLSLLQSASISTIDSFCINLVRENFFKLGIEQDFSIMDDSQKQIIEQSVVDELLAEMYESRDKNFLLLIEMLSTAKSDADLGDTIRNINRYISAQAFPFKWLDDAKELYNPSLKLDNSTIKEYVFNEIEKLLKFALTLAQDAINDLSPSDLMYEDYLSMLKAEYDMINDLCHKVSVSSWDDMRVALNDVTYKNAPSKKGYTSPSKEYIFAKRANYKNLITSAKDFLSISSEEFEEDNKNIYSAFCLLVDLVKEFNKRVDIAKREENSYTFADLERFAFDLTYTVDENGNVGKSDLAKEYCDKYNGILVDEYQDTNSLQDTLFRNLCNDRAMFVVGDVKQSIYKFRLAMPQIFNAIKSGSSMYSKNDSNVNQCIILDSNFRSKKGICDYTNFVFSKIMSQMVGEVDYNKNEYLNFGATRYEDNSQTNVILNLVETPANEDADEYEAHQVAKFIKQKIAQKEQVQGENGLRDIDYGDFAILFRKSKGIISTYHKVLSSYGIPTISSNKVNLFDNNEVAILLSLIRTIDNPVLDVPLLATLMSSFYGYTPDEITNAKLKHFSNNLYASIVNDGETFSRFLNDLERYREFASSMSVENLLLQIISETSYLSVISAMGDAEQRKLNVLKFVDIAKKFDAGNNVGLTAFIRYVDSIISSNIDVDSASVVYSNTNCVSLMTIHQSKGLEFPVCILAGTGHKYNEKDADALCLLNDETGVGVKRYNNEWMVRYNTLQYSVIRNKIKYSSLSEELRILYVAITRAMEQFVVFVSNPRMETRVNNLSKRITDTVFNPTTVLDTHSNGDFILMTALLHKDAGKLRELCKTEVQPDFRYDFNMEINFLNEDYFAKVDAEKAQTDRAGYSEALVNDIEERLNFKYERAELSNYSAKRTASSLDDKEHSFEYFAKSKPAFLNSTGLTSAQKGSAMHTFMQYCKYDKSKENLEGEIERLFSNGYLTKEQADSLDRQRLNTLFNSAFADRMFNSDNIYREIKVATFMDVNELEDTSFDDKVLVQGIADCVFEENGELVLVDYKTDKVESEEELLDRYKNQLSFYKMAVSKTLKKPVKEVMLYSFYLNRECKYK